MKRNLIVRLMVIVFFVWSEMAVAVYRELMTLQNSRVKASLDVNGLVSLEDKSSGFILPFDEDIWKVSLVVELTEEGDAEGKVYHFPFYMGVTLVAEIDAKDKEKIIYNYQVDEYRFQVIYELQPDWHFISKQITIHHDKEESFHVKDITVLHSSVQEGALEGSSHYGAALGAASQPIRGGKYGALLRFDAGAKQNGLSLFFVLQNPFMEWSQKLNEISVKYTPDMTWNPRKYGPFVSDRLCTGFAHASGETEPIHSVPDWQYFPEPQERLEQGPQFDMAEIEAITDCVEAFLLYHPKKSVRVHVGWCENDYQIDVGTSEGRTEYKRLIDQAAAIGCQHILYTPANADFAPLKENRDAWNWENILWLNLGQKIRKDEWQPGDPLPDFVKEMLHYALDRDVQLLAYVYPSLPFMQNPLWTKWITDQGKTPGGYLGANTGIMSFQDWLVDKLLAFEKAVLVSGYSFDHWWIAYDEESGRSKYAQWFGCRRILEELRKASPDIVLDGRQQYHHFGPWTWLAGSYPHPYASDEQPQSVRAFPDLHTDRISANRQRSAAWWFRVQNFCPAEIMPGYMTHQSMRFDEDNVCRRDRFLPRDWDYLGWKFSVLSSIITAPYHHVVNMIPARDMKEFEHFCEEDQAWFRDWFDWTDEHMAILKHHKPILGQPMIGKVDGWAACKYDAGFVFLFNPNYRVMNAEFRLDNSIGLDSAGVYLLKVLYPDEEKGMLYGNGPQGHWDYGDSVNVTMEGTQVRVFEILRYAPQSHPMLFNTTGTARINGNTLHVSDVRGKVGETKSIGILLPETLMIDKLIVNGRDTVYQQAGQTITANITFAGEYCDRSHQIGSYQPDFSGGVYQASFAVPQRIFDQLAARREAWPIPYTQEELKATWMGPDRLLIFFQIADPQLDMKMSAELDGKPLEIKKAYSSIYPSSAAKRTYIGFYADVSSLKPDTMHAIRLKLPALQPGQFQGIFLENIESEYTKALNIKKSQD